MFSRSGDVSDANVLVNMHFHIVIISRLGSELVNDRNYRTGKSYIRLFFVVVCCFVFICVFVCDFAVFCCC